MFGPHERYLRRLNYMIAAFELPKTPATMRIGDGAMLNEPGRSMIVYPFKDHLPTALFSYRTDDVDAEFTQTPPNGSVPCTARRPTVRSSPR